MRALRKVRIFNRQGASCSKRKPEVVTARGNPIAANERTDLDHYTQPYNDESVNAFATMLRRQLKVDNTAPAQIFAEKQWKFLIKDALVASIFHLHVKYDQKREYRQSSAAYSVMLSRVLKKDEVGLRTADAGAHEHQHIKR